MNKKRKKNWKRMKEEAPANNVGSGNVAMPDQILFAKDDAKKLASDKKKELKKFSEFIK